jgi:hypothetical protein
MKQGESSSHPLQRWLRAVGTPAVFGEVGDLLGRATQDSSGMFIVDADKNVVRGNEGMESRVSMATMATMATVGRVASAHRGERSVGDRL